MAREAKKDPNELTVEQKLKTLFQPVSYTHLTLPTKLEV